MPEYLFRASGFCMPVSKRNQNDSDEHHEGMLHREKPEDVITHRLIRELNFWTHKLQEQTKRSLDVRCNKRKKAHFLLPRGHHFITG